jgi:CBS domain-containing protein
MIDDADEAGGYLKATFRRLRREGRGDESVLAVFCPRRSQAIEVRECRSCDHCRGLCVDPSDRETFLRCTWQGVATVESLPPKAAEERPTETATARQTNLASIMTSPPYCVTADTSVEALAELFVHAGISAAPVVDAMGKAIGIVSKTDLLNLYTGDEEHGGYDDAAVDGGLALALGQSDRLRPTGKTVRDVMTRLVFALGAEASLSRAAALMSYEGVHRIVVTATDGTPLGIVSSLDILRWMARRDGYVVPSVTRMQSERYVEQKS